MKNPAQHGLSDLRLLRLFVMLAAVLVLLSLQAQAVLADDELGLSKTIDGNPTTIDVGEIINYRIVYSCNSLTGPCGMLTVEDILPPNVTYIQTETAPGFTATFDGTTVTIVSDGVFLDGSQSEALIQVRVDYDTPGGTILSNSATGEVTTPYWQVITPPVTVEVNPPTEQWSIRKSQVRPVPPVGPALNNDVIYDVAICSDSATGNVSLTGVIMVDTLPVGVDIVDADGGTVTGNQISWDLGDLDIAVIGGGCVTRTIVVRYPGPPFSVGDPITNTANATGSYPDSGGNVIVGTGTASTTIADPNPNPSSGKEVAGSPVGINGLGRFYLNINTSTANVPITDLVYTDNIPPELEVTAIQSGQWTPDYVNADVEYSTDNGGAWTLLGTVDGNDDTLFTGLPTTITNIRWTFSYTDPVDGLLKTGVPLGFTTTGGGARPEIRFTPRTVDVVGPPHLPVAAPDSTYQNCAVLTSGGAADQTNCSNVLVRSDRVNLAPLKTRVNGSGDVQPGDTLEYELRLRVTERSGVGLTDPTIVEILPDALEFVSFDGVTFANVAPAEQVAPTLNVLTNYTIGGTTYDTVLVWSWTGYTLTPPASGNSDIIVHLTTRVLPQTAASTYTNQVKFLSNSAGTVCETGSEETDNFDPDDDLDQDGDFAETICGRDLDFVVQQAVVLDSQKWISNPTFPADGTFPGFLEITDPDGAPPYTPPPSLNNAGCPNNGADYTRYPCVVQGFPENTNDDYDDFVYDLYVINNGNVPGNNYIMYDILPYVGDSGSGGPLVNTARNSEFQPYMTGPVSITSVPFAEGNITIEYSNSSNPCRDEVFNDSGLPYDEPAGCTNDWSTTWTDSARAFRIYFNNGTTQIGVGETMRFSVPMRIPADAQSGQIAWNSFAQRITNATSGNRIPTSEPRKVGIMVPERMSVGNFVWIDTNNNGVVDGIEAGVAGIAVSLYRDADNDGVPDGPAIDTDVTDVDGFYLFSDIPYDATDNNQNRYIVGVDNSNFQVAQPLQFHLSSTGDGVDNGVDINDNGIDVTDPSDGAANPYGVLSNSFILNLDTEQTGETQLSNDDTDGPVGMRRGTRGEADNNSDLTIDFGFYRPMSLGNRVWLDEGAGLLREDGLHDLATEPGIAGVTVNLILDANDNNLPDDAVIATDITDANGYYLFSNLGEGNYFVQIDAANFGAGQPLENLFSSPGNTGDDLADLDDNGIDDLTPAANGIFSERINLGLDIEPLNESDLSGDAGDGPFSRGTHEELDQNSDLTVDFGFYEPNFSIGNHVWVDANNSGTRDAPDALVPGGAGLAGVTVSLYLDADTNGIPDGPAIATDVTDGNGYYLFDNLPAGDYVVGIDNTNFGAGQVLEGYTSSFGVNVNGVDGDQDDNGIDNPQPALNGIYSASINLSPFAEPVGETDLSGNAADGAPDYRGNNKEADNNSDLTIDFGFFRSMSIGNRIWYDNGTGGGVASNGIQDGTEPGIANVAVTVYMDNGDGVFNPATDTAVDTDVTDANGYYLFDGLIPGTYFVWVDDTNFQPGGALNDFDSSPGNAADNQTDLDDNGVDENFPATNGVVSVPVVLAWDAEATGETDLSGDIGDGPGSIGSNNESDINSDVTVDFGFNNEPFSLGNRVWFDPNNNSSIDAGELGLPNVTVNLYRDLNNNNAIDAGEFVASDVTDANGYYLFDGLGEGFYFVEIDEREFRVGGDLIDLYSSTIDAGDDQTDSDDNGVNNPTPEVGGLVSERIQLSRNIEPINEADLSGNAADVAPGYRGTHGELDSNSDLTVDFGLYKPASLGNRVWFDANDNGLIDGVESGISGVVVNLYLDANHNGIAEAGEFAGVDITDADGYYLFDDLVPGDYIVEIPNTNFGAGQPLENLFSSTGAAADDTDSNDNGIDDAAPAANGIFSNVVTIAIDSQPVGETDTSSDAGDGPNHIGNNGETDENSDITVDFGFTGGTQMSLGNRVWLDTNNSGNIDGAEAGIANVTVSLYRDSDANGIPDGAVIATTTTDANGYYLFDGLLPGDYVVALGNGNFAAGQPLAGLISSTGSGADDQTDSDDNGLDALNATYGLISTTINLAANSEITTETDLGPGGDGTHGETPDNSELTVDFGLYAPMSIGNRVWFDTDNDGILDAAETGISGVGVTLFRDDNHNGLPDAGEAVATDTTDANGYYLFDGLGEGDYIVQVDAANFGAGQPLVSLDSSTGSTTNNNDNNDNGIDDLNPDVNGINSNIITLAYGAAPTNETDIGPDGTGANGETNNNSNLSVDFGFYGSTMSLGNRVWFDDGAGTPANARNGVLDAGEVGVGNVRVSLYWDANNDGVPDGAAIATDTTDANGYYLFDGLAPGSYLVGIDSTNFTGSRPLVGYTSTVTGAPDTDNTDNGVDDTNPGVNGILSSTVVLQPTTEPVGEADLGPDGNGTNGETDDNANLTVDFGFFRPMSIGNRVWFDPNDNALIDATENGIAGVTVTLYLDANTNGIAEPGEAVATDITDSLGYYLFDGLNPGQYIVGVDNTNFAGAGALVGFNSSTGSFADIVDRNDNGVDDAAPATNGIYSNAVTLAYGATPTGESDLSGNAADGPNFRGNNGEVDNNSDLTIDFGFVAGQMSLGNRVWFDDGGGTPANADNGLFDAGEAGIRNVVVNLYADANSDGVPDGAVIATDTTDANGYYLFDGLPPGNYLVQVASSNFQTGGALFGLYSSTGSDATTTVDSNDNGIDTLNPGSTGILSNTIALVANNAPVGETDLGPDGNGTNGETDDNANLTIDFGFVVRYDLGDAPDSYGTLVGSNGPQHRIIATLQLGDVIDDELDGQPSVGADGDDTNGTSDDEDSVTFPTFVAGTTVDVDVTVFNNTGGPANLIVWIDFDGNGVFDASEGFAVTVPSSATTQVVQVPITVPIDADTTTGGATYARVRLTTDGITTGNPTGLASDGEVEDYVVAVNPPGVAITKSNGESSIVVGQPTTYTITVNNSGPDVTHRGFDDDIPIGDPDGFDPATITWTCTATRGASCISGMPAGTGDAGAGQIHTFIDIPRGGRIVYHLTGTLRPNYSLPTVANTASLSSGESATDTDGVISDPPHGTKIGVVVSGNLVRWTMTWLNTGGLEAATVTDTLRAGQTFAGNLTCTAYGVSTTTTCAFAANTVTWSGLIGNGNANRVEVAFDVVVDPADAPYTNVATIDVAGAVATAAGSVGRAPGSGSGSTDASAAGLSDTTGLNPVISKVGAPALAAVGGNVTWTIAVTNPYGVDLTGVSFADTVPAQLEILSATATGGTVTVSGQTVQFNIAILPANSTITITIVTRLRSGSEAGVIENLVILDSPYVGSAAASVFTPTELPRTGDTPWWMTLSQIGLLTLAGSSGLWLTRGYWRKSRQKE